MHILLGEYLIDLSKMESIVPVRTNYWSSQVVTVQLKEHGTVLHGTVQHRIEFCGTCNVSNNIEYG